MALLIVGKTRPPGRTSNKHAMPQRTHSPLLPWLVVPGTLLYGPDGTASRSKLPLSYPHSEFL